MSVNASGLKFAHVFKAHNILSILRSPPDLQLLAITQFESVIQPISALEGADIVRSEVLSHLIELDETLNVTRNTFNTSYVNSDTS